MEQLEDESKKSGWKFLIILILILVVTSSLFVYWFVPLNSVSFGNSSGNSNFSLGSLEMQFYENMRFPESIISYRIYDCPLQKNNDMKRAFEILDNKTVLNFYPVTSGEEITITCDSRNRLNEGLFIAGEGGPTNITKTDKFNVILNGDILLIRDSNCEIPNVAIHELLHVLGFDHSLNKNNIMYNISSCKQTIGEDLIASIDKLYSIESLPDLTLENVSATMNGKYLNTNISVRNNGLKDSSAFKINIYADEKIIKSIDVERLNIGYGTIIALSNVLVNQISVNQILFEIEFSGREMDKNNNQIVLNQ